MAMRKMVLVILFFAMTGLARAQDQEVRQLILNVEKLDQLREMLEQMKAKYQILTQGYQQLQQIHQGSFELHSLFLSRLTQVNPKIRQYHKIGEIGQMQLQLLRGFGNVIGSLQANDFIELKDINFLETAFASLRKSSWRNLEELALILTDNELELTDAERIKGIDRIHQDMSGILTDFRNLSLKGSQLGDHRKYLKADFQTLQAILDYE